MAFVTASKVLFGRQPCCQPCPVNHPENVLFRVNQLVNLPFGNHAQMPDSVDTALDTLPLDTGASISEVTQVVDDFLAQFAHQAPVVIADSAVGVLPRASNNDVIAGAVHRGRVHLFLSQIPNRTAAIRVLWHESLHYGLRHFLT